MKTCLIACAVVVFSGSLFSAGALQAETLRQAVPLVQQLEQTDSPYLAEQARARGDARRGALVFFKSAANCVGCHSSGSEQSPLGPNLALLGSELSDEYLVDALLRPSKHIREGFETYSVVTVDGSAHVGLLARQDDTSVTMRLAQSLDQELVISRDEIEAMRKSAKSMMPDGLIGTLKTQREFLDLVRYVLEVARGGVDAATQLRPTPEQLAVRDDSENLDHAGIIAGMKTRDFDAGKLLFHGDCSNCHGTDGDTPSLATSRAFGTQKLKFGSDPYRMFMTLTKGNGLMAPMSYLTPQERYQVVHYIREAFMKDRNPDYFKVDKAYLNSLPKGTENGTRIDVIERDFGLALGSQLRRDFPSVLSIRLGEMTVAKNLHTMDLADVWTGGFLDLSETQHIRPRGEGTANPSGNSVPGLAAWEWGHNSTLDYPREDLLPRGPLPQTWMDYHGYYVNGSDVILSYQIDHREILERMQAIGSSTLIHHLEIAAGNELVVAVGRGPNASTLETINGVAVLQSRDANPGTTSAFTAAKIIGDIDGAVFTQASKERLQLTIPADEKPRTIQVVVGVGNTSNELKQFQTQVESLDGAKSLSKLTQGGDSRWPEMIETVGYLGLEQDGYVLDTLTHPDSTPWSTWFRTSALDFFPDGRMAVATHGGDIWIVSGIDDELLNLKWKRFAGGLYEAFGVRVVNGDVYVTCKDRITRLKDLNGDDEADFYESFNADTDVSTNFHAFNFDLQTDDEGNFYYAKSGHGADFALPGAVWKISPDGKYREVVCTGFRSPNGLGSMPGGRITVSDNQGQWIPASKICLTKPGKFYGWVPTYSIPGKWSPDGGEIDIKAITPPTSFEQPLVWMPQEFDNSSGGQIWVDDARFGPLAGHLLHTSFGKGWMSYMMIQDVGETSQAAIVKLPFDFASGIMRGHVNPMDGQVYATGLQGWNGGGRAGLVDGGVQRLRYTGTAPRMITDARVVHDGLELEFNFELNLDTAKDAASYTVEQWNYHWSHNYGSDQYKPSNDKPGTELAKIEDVEFQSNVENKDKTRVHLVIPAIRPVNQLRLQVNLQDAQGNSFVEEVYWTINAVPAKE